MIGMNEQDGHFDGVTSYRDLYNAQWRYLNDKRGADTQASTDRAGSFPIPRATNEDVRALVSYWSGVLRGKVSNVWTRTVEDVERLTRSATPSAVYSNNTDLWHVLKAIAGPGAVTSFATVAEAA